MKKLKQSKSPIRGLISGAISFGAFSLLYSSIFPLYKFGHYALMLGVCSIVGFVAYNMGAGLDTSHKPNEKEEFIETGDEELDAFIKKAKSMLDEIKQKNDAIEDEGISKKLDEIYDLSNKIFRLVIENPKKLPQIRRFMDYYLPMCLKILAGYSKMDKLKIENTVVTKEKVEASLELVRQAFKNQLSKLYRDDYLDVSTDMEVLEKLLEKDNLLDGRGFNIKVNSERAAGGATALASEEEKK